VQSPIEFGHKVFLAESARGLITQYDVLDGNPIDEQHVVISLERHRQTFGEVPEFYGSDRGFFSEKNVMSCKQQGVKIVCIPQRGGAKAPERQAYEKSGEFKDGQRFRAGIEGRISVLFRGRGMKRCPAIRTNLLRASPSTSPPPASTSTSSRWTRRSGTAGSAEGVPSTARARRRRQPPSRLLRPASRCCDGSEAR
jgi:IS5 family transposase